MWRSMVSVRCAFAERPVGRWLTGNRWCLRQPGGATIDRLWCTASVVTGGRLERRAVPGAG
jgi:hypothetical protein